MGFDIECIIDIHTYPGEYFCPVCRTLVYPNEALQSQCTHLYCKPCLAHVANGSKACPYDGYLVTESDSKPLMESDKALAENIGKVKVHCLFFRSGCTWEGALSDCTTHCSACSFGNSPVICNRCGIQIVHRQVHDHAQSCPGGYEAQHVVGGVAGATGSGAASSTTTAEMNRTVTQSAAALTQGQNSQNAAANLVPAQSSNQQINASSNAQVVTPGAVPTPDNWYQQQYQQYYQQYMGYESYQQPSHQYYPFLQYQQYPVPVQGQHQSHVHTMAPPQAQAQTQLLQHQPHLVSQTPQQGPPQPQAQGQAQVPIQGQAQQQPQLQLLPQAQSQGQVPPQGQAQFHAPSQASAPNYQVNQAQQPLPPVHSQAHTIPHTVPPLPPPPPHGQPGPYAQGMSMQPPAQRHHVPQYQQPAVQMHHPQASQSHVQPQIHPQPLPLPPPPPLTQTSNQSHGQAQPQGQQYHTQPQTHFRPPSQPNHPTVPASLSHAPHTPALPVSGHHSYQQPHPAPQMQSGLSQQHPVYPHLTGGNLHPVPGQAPQQPIMMRPPQSLASMPQQQSTTALPLQSQVPGNPPLHQQFPPHQLQQRAGVQPVQQAIPQQHAQQPFVAPFQGHMHQQSHFPPQQPMQPPRPYGPPHSQPSQSYVGRPTMPNLGMAPQANPQLSGGTGPYPHSDPAQMGLKQTYNQDNADPIVLEQNATKQETIPPSKGLAEKGSGAVSVMESDGGKHETAVKNDENATKDGLVKPFIKQEEGGLEPSLKLAPGGKPSETGNQENELRKEKSNMLADSDSMKQAELENQEGKLPKAVITGPASPYFDKEFRTPVSASSTDGYVQSSKSHGPIQPRPQAQMPGQQGFLPHPGQSFNPTEGRGSGYFGPPKSFESPSVPQGSSLASSADPRGITGRDPQPRFEGHFGPHHNAKPSETAILKDQLPVEGGTFRQTYGNEPSFLGTNGGTALETSRFGLRDDKMKAFSGERMNPFPEPAQIFDQGSISKMPHGPNHDPGSKFEPALGSHSRFLPPPHPSIVHGRMDDFGAGPGFGQYKHLAPRSPEREYHGISPRRYGGPSIFPRGSSAFDDVNGREASRFGDGPRYFNQSLDRGNPFHDGRFPPLGGHPRRGDMDGPDNLRFGEHMAPPPLQNFNRGDNVFVKDGADHLMRGEFSGPGFFSGRFNTAEATGPGAFHGPARAGELGGPGNFPGMWNSNSVQGFPNATNFAGGMDSYDPSRKRRSMSSGWCRICKVDCDTVEGLDMHSQTIEHQKTTMDMVKSIKQQNRKKQRSSAGHIAQDGGRARKAGFEYRGNKP